MRKNVSEAECLTGEEEGPVGKRRVRNSRRRLVCEVSLAMSI